MKVLKIHLTIRINLNDIIFKTLDEVFIDKLSNLKNIEKEINKININNLNINPIIITGKNNETLNTITFNISNINYKYGYSLKKDGHYNFKMNVFTEGDITLDIISNIGESIIEGKLGLGKVGLNGNYILHNLNVDYEAYANINEFEYNKICTRQKYFES